VVPQFRGRPAQGDLSVPDIARCATSRARWAFLLHQQDGGALLVDALDSPGRSPGSKGGPGPMEGSSPAHNRAPAHQGPAQTASICCSPPDRVLPHCRRRSANPGEQLEKPPQVPLISPLPAPGKSPGADFSRTVSLPRCRWPSGTWAMPRPTRQVGRHPRRSRPSQGHPPAGPSGSIRKFACRTMTSPAPLAPMRVTDLTMPRQRDPRTASMRS